MIVLLHGTISISIASIFGGVFSIILILIAVFVRRSVAIRDKTIETMKNEIKKNKELISDHVTNEKVAQKSFDDYKEFKEKEDKGFKTLLSGLGDKIDGVLNKIDGLKEDIHNIELQFAGGNKSKK